LNKVNATQGESNAVVHGVQLNHKQLKKEKTFMYEGKWQFYPLEAIIKMGSKSNWITRNLWSVTNGRVDDDAINLAVLPIWVWILSLQATFISVN